MFVSGSKLTICPLAKASCVTGSIVISASTIESGSCYSDLSNLSCGNIDCCIIINPANKVLQEASLIVNSTGGHSKIIDLKDLKIFIAGNKFVDKMVSEMIEESLNT